MAKKKPKRCGELSGSLTKAGEPCGAYARKGKTTCMGHADRAEQDAAGFGGSENGRKGGEATRVPKLTELLRQRVEERADEILDKLFGMLDAERAVVVGTGPKARLEIVEDPDLVLKAIKEIYDRAEGRPKSVSEFTGEVKHRHEDQLDRAIEGELQRLSERLAEQDAARDPA